MSPDWAAAYAVALEDAKAAWTDDPYCPPPPVTAVAAVLCLPAADLDMHVEGVHGWEWHDEGYEEHVWEAADCLRRGGCGGAAEPIGAGDVERLLAKLPDLLAQQAHLTLNDSRVIQHLASRPQAVRTARCPVCVTGVPCREFQAPSDEGLFAMIANHVIAVHGGGAVDAFSSAEKVLPHVGAAYRKDAEQRPWLYRSQGGGT